MLYIVKRETAFLRAFHSYTDADTYITTQKGHWHDHCCRCECDRGYDHTHRTYNYSIVEFDTEVDINNGYLYFIIYNKNIIHACNSYNALTDFIIQAKDQEAQNLKDDLEYNDGYIRDTCTDKYKLCICRYGSYEQPDADMGFCVCEDDDQVIYNG
jgi:hypothetical protein